jgi:adenylate cyclase
MTTSIHDHGGTVDKFIGDAIMAFWNAPRPDENHAENACLAALGCLRANRAIDDALAEAGQPPMPTRFGLHTGEVVVGNVGSNDRMQYTALGSNVNLASRVESLNKQYGTQVLATGSVERIARHRFVFRQVDLAIPSGLSEPIALFELIGARDPESPFACPPEVIDRCRRWQDAMDLYLGQRWREAEDAFRALAGEPGNAVLSALYLDRCARLLANPPGDDWDGAERFTSK